MTLCTFGYWTFEGLIRMFKAMCMRAVKTLYLLWGMYVCPMARLLIERLPFRRPLLDSRTRKEVACAIGRVAVSRVEPLGNYRSQGARHEKASSGRHFPHWLYTL